MKLYAKLALTGIMKNKRLYLPYILTCVGMVGMYYIIIFLAMAPMVLALPGGAVLQTMMNLGSGVMAVFTVIFLFYTNSFLMRRRKKEFGLYNILGMGKGSIARILLWETLLIALFSLAFGLFAGVGLSKLAELVLVNIMEGEVSYGLTISFVGMGQTCVLFIIIFFMLFLNALQQVHLSNPITLLRSENVGEKPPRANWVIGILGVILLGIAYYLAVTIDDPLTTLAMFFVAVVMVIAATYMIFICGSVLLCRILQKRKNYYYKANHFVSVSSMAFRMKRNGAGLASICILATMVLVMIAGSACLYFGKEDSLRTRYPNDINIILRYETVTELDQEGTAPVRERLEQVLEEKNAEIHNLVDYRNVSVTGYLGDGRLETNYKVVEELGLDTYANVYQVYFIPLEDYNRMMGTAEALSPGEALLYANREDYPFDTMSIQGASEITIKKRLKEFVGDAWTAMDVVSSLFLVVPDLESTTKPLVESGAAYLNWNYDFDVELPDEQATELGNAISAVLAELGENEAFKSYSIDCLAANRADFYGTYGGIFFLGIMLSIVFLFAAVLIIYYKQVSEGYEDQARFDIMQKVGMTKRDIRRSINSQMLTVFFLPLVTAVMHLGFAFPMIYNLLKLFNLVNLRLLLGIAGVSVLVFALFYVVVYRITSNAYYAIVSGGREK